MLKDVRKAALEFLKTVVIAFLLAHFIMVSVAQAFQVEQFSMEPNLLPHDRVLVNKLVAVAGQRVEIRDGAVYVDSRPLREPYLRAPTSGDYGPESVPARDIFVLGDNRGNSEDSRAFGFVPMRNIVGEAIVIYWPPQRFHMLF